MFKITLVNIVVFLLLALLGLYTLLPLTMFGLWLAFPEYFRLEMVTGVVLFWIISILLVILVGDIRNEARHHKK